ncbi:PTS system lichenan-specific EIIC component [Oceanobacillus picturae]|uniref:Permease IIC component n=1 Tax=Oceanobacillus picturae TaxID=171693 RepID=A0A0U9H3B3_9BACI|nr:PTS cellobiose transporter subunit IIC [Oceanobacillus picturae]GAQ16959.1 PTS system lichenan-specific EIIC component [Oceanobacillus picturae]
MNRFTKFLEEKFMPVAGRIAGQRHLQSLRDGIILTMPLVIIGSFFLILMFIPIPGYEGFMANIFGDAWKDKLGYPVSATFDIMALVASIGVAYNLALKYKLDGLTAGAISLAAFLLATPYTTMFTPEGSDTAYEVGGVIPAALMGSQGLFVALLIGMLSTEVYRWVVSKNLTIKMPAGVPPSVAKSFVALVPGFAVIAIVWIVRLIIEATPFESIHNIVGDLLYTPLSAVGGSLTGSLVAVTLIILLWVAGLHGASIVGGVMDPIWLSKMDENRIAFQEGMAAADLPNIFTKQFFDIFVFMGGSGATFALVIAILFWAKSKQMKQLGRLSVGPGVFNINEPIIFGMPIVLNPLLIIPFLLTPLVIVLTTYIAMSTGLVPKPIGIAVPWTTPPVIGGYLATGSLAGSILQLINIFIGLLIYLPFFKIWDTMKVKEEKAAEETN